jgi:hypothetical protein
MVVPVVVKVAVVTLLVPLWLRLSLLLPLLLLLLLLAVAEEEELPPADAYLMGSQNSGSKISTWQRGMPLLIARAVASAACMDIQQQHTEYRHTLDHLTD